MSISSEGSSVYLNLPSPFRLLWCNGRIVTWPFIVVGFLVSIQTIFPLKLNTPSFWGGMFALMLVILTAWYDYSQLRRLKRLYRHPDIVDGQITSISSLPGSVGKVPVYNYEFKCGGKRYKNTIPCAVTFFGAPLSKGSVKIAVDPNDPRNSDILDRYKS
jgi:hypothetical protein